MASIIRVFIGDADAVIIAQEQRMTNQTKFPDKRQYLKVILDFIKYR